MFQEHSRNYDIERGLENLSRMIPAEGWQREHFEKLAGMMREVLQDIQHNGITPENTLAWQKHLHQLHVLGFQQHPPITFNDLCRADRDYSRLALDRAERNTEKQRECFGR